MREKLNVLQPTVSAFPATCRVSIRFGFGQTWWYEIDPNGGPKFLRDISDRVPGFETEEHPSILRMVTDHWMQTLKRNKVAMLHDYRHLINSSGMPNPKLPPLTRGVILTLMRLDVEKHGRYTGIVFCSQKELEQAMRRVIDRHGRN